MRCYVCGAYFVVPIMCRENVTYGNTKSIQTEFIICLISFSHTSACPKNLPSGISPERKLQFLILHSVNPHKGRSIRISTNCKTSQTRAQV